MKPARDSMGAAAMDDSTSDEIARLEAEIERLAASAEGCRRLILLGRMAVIGGGAIFLASLTGFFHVPAAAYLAATALILGGIIVWGTNQSTLDERLAGMAELEAQRSALIDTLELE